MYLNGGIPNVLIEARIFRGDVVHHTAFTTTPSQFDVLLMDCSPLSHNNNLYCAMDSGRDTH